MRETRFGLAGMEETEEQKRLRIQQSLRCGSGLVSALQGDFSGIQEGRSVDPSQMPTWWGSPEPDHELHGSPPVPTAHFLTPSPSPSKRVASFAAARHSNRQQEAPVQPKPRRRIQTVWFEEEAGRDGSMLVDAAQGMGPEVRPRSSGGTASASPSEKPSPTGKLRPKSSSPGVSWRNRSGAFVSFFHVRTRTHTRTHSLTHMHACTHMSALTHKCKHTCTHTNTQQKESHSVCSWF